MKTIGIVRKLDDLGRIVIPKETREQLYIAIKEPIEIFLDEEETAIILKKYTPGCVLCGEMGESKIINGKTVCSTCLEKAKREF
jgi:AbrB family transcriptional regulator, transcriptional pleiotropic regulator of transition state genes